MDDGTFTRSSALPINAVAPYRLLQGEGVPTNCQHLCSRTEEITLFDFLTCQDHLTSVSHCLLGGEDRSPCCREKGVPELCLGFCSGDMLTMDSSHFSCVPHIQDLTTCIQMPPTGDIHTSALPPTMSSTPGLIKTSGYLFPVSPSSPRNLTAETLSSTSIRLSWLPPAVHAADVSEYVVRYLAYGTDVFQQMTQPAANGTSVVLDGLNANTTYQFQVSARSQNGTSLPSEPVIQSTAGDFGSVGLPGRPRNVQAVQFSPLSVLLSWDPPQQRPGTITVYSITYWNTAELQPHTGMLEVSAAAADNVAVVHHLQEDTTYHFQVAARNTNGTGLPSDIVQATTGYERIHNVSFMLEAVTLGPTEVQLTWTRPDVLHVAVVAYTVQYRPSGGETHEEKVNGNTTTLTVADLAPGTVYMFSVMAAIVTPDLSIAVVESNTANATTQVAATDPSILTSPSPTNIITTTPTYQLVSSSLQISTTSPVVPGPPSKPQTSTVPPTISSPTPTANTPAEADSHSTTTTVAPASHTTIGLPSSKAVLTTTPTTVTPASQTTIRLPSSSKAVLTTLSPPVKLGSTTSAQTVTMRVTPRELPCGAGREGYCLNNGHCYMLQVESGRTSYYCKCTSDWIGTRCQNPNIIGNNSPSTGKGEEKQKVSIAVAVSVLLVLVIVGMVILYHLRSCLNKHKQALSVRGDRSGELGSFNNPMYGEENELQCTLSSAGGTAITQVLQSLMQDFHNSLDDDGYTPLTFRSKMGPAAYESPFGEGEGETLGDSNGYDNVGLVVPSRSSSTHNFNNPGYSHVVREIQA
ncbi:PTPRF [Branchiostoma lanceolatum]|uniref:PTPRF protein n=1 Tax=Branchiostoma lanceolatum TaxID=7740 RepID=A0A8J9ZX98_BRALA|nr:PTPRF [Branchiostoma lanceolatum]